MLCDAILQPSLRCNMLAVIIKLHFTSKACVTQGRVAAVLVCIYAGPLLQCVVWHDGTHWRAALDTQDMYEPDSGKGKLADFQPLTNYKTEQAYGTFSKEDGCNFVCNIYEGGDVLSIVVDSGSHGTHVAGITAAHQPDNPNLNGIAPGMLLWQQACRDWRPCLAIKICTLHVALPYKLNARCFRPEGPLLVPLYCALQSI